MGELTWRRYPVDGIPHNITGNFGDWYGSYAHRGTDVGVYNVPVYAPQDGEVVPMLNDGSFGIAVCLEHPGTGWYSNYCHLSYASVKIGDHVEAGQQIGISGNTGYSNGPHLHWQVCNNSNFTTSMDDNRDPMAVPFEGEEEDEMTAEERELLMLCASVVGGWSSGQEFASITEALTQMRKFEATDQRVLIGLGLLNDSLNSTISALNGHLMGDEESVEMMTASLDKAAEDIAAVGTRSRE